MNCPYSFDEARISKTFIARFLFRLKILIISTYLPVVSSYSFKTFRYSIEKNAVMNYFIQESSSI
jgi:hypothetical protein